MCLSIPSKVVAIDTETNTATVETLGVTRRTSLDLLAEPVAIGDYVLLHVGYAMNKIDYEDAMESIRVYESIIQMMEEEESGTVRPEAEATHG